MIEKGRHTKHTAEDTFYSSSDKRTYNGTLIQTHTYTRTNMFSTKHCATNIQMYSIFYVLSVLIQQHQSNTMVLYFFIIFSPLKKVRLYAILIDTINWWLKYFHSKYISSHRLTCFPESIAMLFPRQALFIGTVTASLTLEVHSRSNWGQLNGIETWHNSNACLAWARIGPRRSNK